MGLIRRMVVTTARGDFITDLDIEERQIVGALCAWLGLLPDAGIYIDGELVPDEVRVAIRFALASETAPSPAVQVAPVPPPEPEKLRDYTETLQRAFDDLRQGHVQTLRDMQDCARRFSEMWLERERQFADEAARQRELTGKSLADVDLLGRSVKAVQLEDVIALSTARSGARAGSGDRITVMDFIGGLFKTFTGEN
ncbi:hypothetical protein SAMN02745121_08627 [Nannocystis exedens]|uniref:Uncharacterized protein n=3 Tax=Nannocystis exedens TaxID=54 RepID=A0A1I2IHG8_9BACT|nr:hypothetical protein NAEX_01232 [Nannocystis exedens]SFF40276.1 hypothetical protein SAMN02745121_08627 [Nannocystis exedens]